MMFASKTPRDLNHDPLPYVWNGHSPAARRRDDCRTEYRASPNYEQDPRPEFDHVQHNAPNPVLVAFRVHNIEAARPGSWESRATPEGWLDYTEGCYQGPREYISHARRVLTRLANLSQIGA